MIVDRDEGIVDIDGRPYYVVADLDRIPPFLTSVISDGDRWMFASTGGALTAGRFDADRSLFPYQTDDKIHAAAGQVGPVTRLRLADGRVWRPFLDRPTNGSRRNFAKAVFGDGLIVEESDASTGLVVSYRWESSWQHGFVRTVLLTNPSDATVTCGVLDGIVNVLPHGVDPLLHQRLSNLSNAYKRSEMVDDRLAVFSLESPVSDSADPAEVLRATAVWSTGLPGAVVSLDAAALEAFDQGRAVGPAPLITGRPGAYLMTTTVSLAPGAATSWRIIADVALDQAGIMTLAADRSGSDDIDDAIEAALDAGHDRVEQIMALADAAQRTGDGVAVAHHVANTTYNVLRGGVPLDGYRIDSADFAGFVDQRNRAVATTHSAWIAALPEHIERAELLDRVGAVGDPHLQRLALEYLPFSFSRRHGDPSRPWNKFSIRVHDDKGRPVIHYEGNWRDVFQNWEALCLSFPDYLLGTIATFVNASTPDGYNPYRISRDGIDWEVPDPDDPWANIGYWGDHQLIYLLRLIEMAESHRPADVARLLSSRSFVYADVPYRIASFDELVADPKATIEFDEDANRSLLARAERDGGDGKLVRSAEGEIVTVTLLEKLLVSVLAKLANFVPGGGIWMNTQRPEWNDANNALVGYGMSVVTLCHLRRSLVRLRSLVSESPNTAEVAVEAVEWMADTSAALAGSPVTPDGSADRHRADLLGRLARPASDHRRAVYDAGFSGDTGDVSNEMVIELCDRALAHIDESIRLNRRADGLMHSYNLLAFSHDGTDVSVSHLPEMLEGQVAALSSGALSPAEQADLLDALFESRLYRADVGTFTLAAAELPPAFLDKNIVPPDAVDSDPLIRALLDAGDSRVVARDPAGQVRFHADIVDAPALDRRLDALATEQRWAALIDDHRSIAHTTFERTFAHQAFLGRSEAMHAFEGIGSVYWHMVSKLLLAAQEAAIDAADTGADDATVARLVASYDRIRSGLGFNRTAAEYGAVPTEPYSHTPAHAGAQQPGMTGAVKEELLARRAELGVRVAGGEIIFDPLLLRDSELTTGDVSWSVRTVGGTDHITLPSRSVGLTIAQTPVVVTRTDGSSHVDVEYSDGRTERREGRRVGADVSQMVFARTGEIRLLHATLGGRSGDG